MAIAKLQFCCAKTVIRFDKDLNDGIKRFKRPCKTPASPSQNGNVVPQVGVYALNGKRVAFIADISDVLARVNHVNIAQKPIRTIFIRIRRRIYNCLNPLRRFIPSHIKTHDLARLTAYHRQQIHIFARFGARLALNEPIKLIELESFRRAFNSHFVFFIQL